MRGVECRRCWQATEPTLAVASTNATATVPDSRAKRLPRRVKADMRLKGDGVMMALTGA